MSGTTDNRRSAHWVVVPAAGTGRRMGSEIPKQYLPLKDETVLSITLARLAQGIEPRAIVVALAEDDAWWPRIDKPDIDLITAPGGEERCDSVLNALQSLSDQASPEDWIWVHDAARPCVRTEDLISLRERIESHSVGGLLALKMTDTVKQSDSHQAVAATVDRSVLWRALTPQVFRYGLLLEALRRSIEGGHRVTDEAQSMELAGYKPLLVEGGADNIKITSPGDLEVAELFLSRQEAGTRQQASTV